MANPGCYPTTAILALSPLLKAGLIEAGDIIVDAKSGVSGAGRTPKLTTLYPECNESISAYNIGRHRHTPEIDQFLTWAAGKPVEVIFTPQLVPMDRGILTTAYARPTGPIRKRSSCRRSKRSMPTSPSCASSSVCRAPRIGPTNYCDITARLVRGRVLTISCIDHLIKGTSGAAVQNFNLVFGYPETTAL